ncbi:Winged helix-turn-helix DNA-binding domain [Phytophthora cactorum]|nr:Winged helix-turn-helix DNA-binding domain [Phytophthora cactorum]
MGLIKIVLPLTLPHSLYWPDRCCLCEGPEGAVKYRLVEAEEVSDKPQTAPTSRASKPKRKSKLNWSSVPYGGRGQRSGPEGDSIQVDAGASASSDVRTRGVQQQGRRGPRSGGRFGGRRQHGDGNATYVNGVYVPTPDVKVTAQWAKNQIEFYFTSDNLVRDIFLRQHMDVEDRPSRFCGQLPGGLLGPPGLRVSAGGHEALGNGGIGEQNEKIVSVKDGKSGSGPMPREDMGEAPADKKTA